VTETNQGCDYGSAHARRRRGRDLIVRMLRGGQAGVQQADDGQPDDSSAYRGGKGIELAEESAGEGNANQRNQKKISRLPSMGER
jgi:hypothetical protein